MGDPTIDEPVTATLFQNALLIIEGQTVHTIENGKITKWNGARELQPLFDTRVAPTDAQREAAITFQFKQILKRPPTDGELEKFVALLKKNVSEAGHMVGARYTLATVLMLPEALFRMEVGSGQPDDKGRVRLAPREIAFAIAYALTDSPVELMKRLASSERVEQVFVRHACRYGLGRNESPGDAASLQAAHKAYQEGGGSMKAILTALLTSESFLYRVPASPEPNAAPHAAAKNSNP